MSVSAAGKFQDHYSVLGIEPNSDTDVIHRAYSTLAARFHPDNKHTADKARFAAVTLAYEVLSDPEARGMQSLRVLQSSVLNPPVHGMSAATAPPWRFFVCDDDG